MIIHLISKHHQTLITSKPIPQVWIFLLCIGILVLAACSSTPPKSPNTIYDTLQPYTNNTQASAQFTLLEQAIVFNREGKFEDSYRLLQRINLRLLPTKEHDYYYEFQASTHLALGRVQEALGYLNELKKLAPSAKAQALQRRIQLAQDVYTANNLYLEAALAAIELDQYTNITEPSNRLSLNNTIWQLLSQADPANINAVLAQTITAHARGWLNLALAIQDKNNPASINEVLRTWQAKHKNHPAKTVLPTPLQIALEQTPKPVNKIAVILPQSGPLAPLGDITLKGFMSSYYQHFTACQTSVCLTNSTEFALVQNRTSAQGFIDTTSKDQYYSSPPPAVLVIDEVKITDWQALYKNLQKQSVDLVIGPLQKHNVEEVDALVERNIFTLSLNYLPFDIELPEVNFADKTVLDPSINNTFFNNNDELSSATSSNLSDRLNTLEQDNSPKLLYESYSPNRTSPLIQFGFSVENEAAQLARIGLMLGFKNALILHTNKEWAHRASLSFQQQWLNAEQSIVNVSKYLPGNNYIKVIEDALAVSASKSRHQGIENIIGDEVSFEPRRRQDVDMILLLSDSQKARQIIPTLAFHNASGIPVYANQYIYQVGKDRTINKDLDGVTFTDIPWLLQPEPLALEIDNIWSSQEKFSRLFALGIDAFRLYPHIQSMYFYKDIKLQGATGLLHIMDNKVVAELSLAKFKRGVPQLQDIQTLIDQSEY